MPMSTEPVARSLRPAHGDLLSAILGMLICKDGVFLAILRTLARVSIALRNRVWGVVKSLSL